MKKFKIARCHARAIAQSYGLATLENISIPFLARRSKVRLYSVPILNITDSKVNLRLNFTQGFLLSLLPNKTCEDERLLFFQASVAFS
ncbi:MAG: hypothetical protein KME19_19545 [Microcoleus vaginatus WJT46-NPBG5]|nr:hypothetical protein [Microcoleus vaginatus WJT46-NPBG5]